MLMTSFLQHADIVVLSVVVLLLLGSIASWAIIVDIVVRLARLRSAVGRVEDWSRHPGRGGSEATGLVPMLLAARDAERPGPEGPADLRTRRDAAMRAAYMPELRRQEPGLSFLATLASAAPFIGLFGTVWGIMQSFSSMAAAKDTSLAVVAPGISEALFATAIGLGTAIPAVVAYNLTRATLLRFNYRLAAAAARLAKASVGTAAPGTP